MEARANCRRLDRNGAQLRWPFKKTCAASVLTFAVQEGMFEFGTFKSFAAGDEAMLLRQLFGLLQQLGDHTLVIWGGFDPFNPAPRSGDAARGAEGRSACRGQAARRDALAQAGDRSHRAGGGAFALGRTAVVGVPATFCWSDRRAAAKPTSRTELPNWRR